MCKCVAISPQTKYLKKINTQSDKPHKYLLIRINRVFAKTL